MAEEAKLQGTSPPPSIAPPSVSSSSDPSTSHQVAQAQQRIIEQDDETTAQQQQSSSYKATSEIASRFIEVIDPNNKSHVDTAAPIDSVKGAVTKFGGILDWRDKRKQAQDDELDVIQVQEEVTEYHKRWVSAEAARSQALVELERAASAADKLRLSLQRAQVEDAQARQEADLAHRRLGESQRAATERAAAKAELDAIGSRRAAALADLKAARAELDSMDKVRAAAVAEADAAVARAREAVAATLTY